MNNKPICGEWHSWERQYCCELCRYYGGGDEMECAHCDPMDIKEANNE